MNGLVATVLVGPTMAFRDGRRRVVKVAVATMFSRMRNNLEKRDRGNVLETYHNLEPNLQISS